MFTGIVHHCGKILSITETPNSAIFCIETLFEDLAIGESIAVNGSCLTVTKLEPHCFFAELSPETMAVTIAGNCVVGELVNLERAMTLTDRLGGHLVSGHVDQTLTVSAIKTLDEFVEIHFSGVRYQDQGYLIPKGSVAINGVSLTVNTISDRAFSVMLIPHTWQHTNLSHLSVAKRVNVEFDLIAKVIGRVTQEYLNQYQLLTKEVVQHDKTSFRQH